MKEVVLITGASSRIDKATAEYLADKGYIVYGTARKVNNAPKNFTLLPMDVRDEKSVQNAINQVIDKEKRLDILINNAGVGISGAVEEIPMDELQNIFQTNFFGAINVIKSVLPIMRNHRIGLIINIT